jgi:hypothetical protein
MTAPEGRRRIPGRLVEWGRRYAPLEILSLLSALAGAGLAGLVTTSAVAIAYAGAWAENIGYYGYAFAREMRWIGRAVPDVAEMAASWPGRAAAAVKALLWEFGTAEVLDSLVVRPACMYAAIALIGNLAAGIVVGKLMADVVFYGIAIVFYEWGKKRRGSGL